MSPSSDRLGSIAPRIASGARSLRALPLTVSILSLLASPAAAQQDPVANFCRRFGHQTAVVDSKLYIDGGLINWDTVGSLSANYTNTWLLYQDLSTSAPNVGMPPLYANLSKNGTIPNTNGGALWSDSVNKRLYLFGGEQNAGEPPMPFNLYGYDILNNQWDSFGPPRSGATISKVSYGAGVSVDTRGEAYYYGGWLSNASVPGWGTGPPVATTGLVKYVMDTNNWSNSTGPDNIRRAEGSLHYIPASGGGMLIYFGGVQDLNGNGTAAQGQPMDKIYVYDILSGRWYTQTATGQIPEMRRRFCAGVTWALDQSSYNIYMYGGASVPGSLGPGFDDIYVLTMPTFTWVKMFPLGQNGTGSNPHHSLSCNIVPGRAQMLIIGGTFPQSEDCDYPVQWGTHNVDLGKQNRNKSIWELYYPNKTAYAVPDEVIAVVGGNSEGSATATAPARGFDNSDLVMMNSMANIIARMPTRAVDTSTPPPPSTVPLGGGVIAGIAVAGAVVLFALATACFCLVRRGGEQRYHNSISPPLQTGQPAYQVQSMSDAWSQPASHLSPMASPYSPPYGQNSPFAPPPQSAQTVPPHLGPPIELPSESPAPTTVTNMTSATTAATTTTPSPAPPRPAPTPTPMAPQSMGGGTRGTASMMMTRSSSVTYPPQQAYFPEPVTLSNQVQYDAQGNMWVPQVSMVQVAPGGSHGGTPPVYTPPLGDRKSPQPTPPPPAVVQQMQPTPPAELPQSPQELSAERDDDDSAGLNVKHQTYYNR